MSTFEATSWWAVDRHAGDGKPAALPVDGKKVATAAALSERQRAPVRLAGGPSSQRRLLRGEKPWRLLLGACLLSLVSACGATSKEDNAAMGSIDGYNSTDQAITPFYVNGYGGVKMGAYSDSGSVCCVVYPKKWYPGLTAKVKWATSSGKSYGDPSLTWHEAEVPIEPYDVPGAMNVHFLPGNQVRILIFNGTPGAEGYKGPPYPEAPPGWTVHSIDDEAELPPVPALPSDEADLPPPPAPPKREIQ